MKTKTYINNLIKNRRLKKPTGKLLDSEAQIKNSNKKPKALKYNQSTLQRKLGRCFELRITVSQ